MTLVVAERNSLVHKMLGSFDPDSEESCRNLIGLLDKQHDRIAPHYKYVMQVLAGMVSLQQKVSRTLESGDML